MVDSVLISILRLFRRNAGIDHNLLQFYLTKSHFPIHKAELLLDYRPRFTIDAGMNQTEQWLMQNGYLPNR